MRSLDGGPPVFADCSFGARGDQSSSGLAGGRIGDVAEVSTGAANRAAAPKEAVLQVLFSATLFSGDE